MPRLAAGALGRGRQRWPRQVIRPTGRPLRELAKELANIANTDPDCVPGRWRRSRRGALLVEPGSERPRPRCERMPGASSGAAADARRLVLVIDQFKECARGRGYRRGQAERDAFIAALHAAATFPPGRGYSRLRW